MVIERIEEIKDGILLKYKFSSKIPFLVVSYIVPYGVTKIGEYAFKDCKNIQELYIPWYVEEIPETNFVDKTGTCDEMIQPKDFTIYGEKGTAAERVAKQTGVKFIESNFILTGCKINAYFGRSEKFVMPEGILSTMGSIFDCAPHIAEVTLPSTLVFMSSGTFLNCKKLETIIIPKSVKCICERVFKGCKNLQSVTFENGNTEIGKSCFVGCSKMLVIKAPAGGNVEKYAKKYNIKFEES